MDEEIKKSDNSRAEGPVKNRRRSRELALYTLYACEVSATDEWQPELERISESNALSPEIKQYARELVRTVIEKLESIDSMLRERAANWELKRMAAIDRNILRLALAELLYFPEVPYRVVIDEAVEMAKAYGTDESGKFVNGIIDSIRKQIAKSTGHSGKDG